MRSKFDEQLALLNRDLTKMGSLCEEALALAAKALANADGQTAAKIAPIDSEIDQMERTIESLCLKLLLQQQPVARDLRQISAALKMITDMERIGDQASDISEIVQTVDVQKFAHELDLASMADAAVRMVTESVDAYVKKDLELAHRVVAEDDIVDAHFVRIKNGLMLHIMNSECALDLLMIAKYLERIGDHAVNIAEWVEFSITGVHTSGE